MASIVLTEAALLPPLNLRRVALPAEHGGWGFLLEPIAAGLAVSFSLGGVWIAVMIIGAFLMRQPLKMFVLNLRGNRDRGHAAAAQKFLLIYSAIFIAGAAGTLMTANLSALVPLTCAIPLAGVQTWFDTFRRSRHIVPELAGAIAISSSIAAIAIAGGASTPIALALWTIMIMRLVPSILYVRQRLLLEKGKPFSLKLPIAAHGIACFFTADLVIAGLASIPVLIVIGVLFGRCLFGLGKNLSHKRTKATTIGIMEVVYGTILVCAIAAGASIK
ncbi:MAG: YwiC-like family protein [Acidobacteriota bacterium]